MCKVRLAGTVNDSITDGPGLRYGIFTQGCSHGCPGCQNPQTHDYSGGYEEDITVLLTAIKRNPMLSGVTFSGGEPFDQPTPLIKLGKEVKALGLELAAYSGYTYEELLEAGGEKKQLLELLDVLIDGRYVEKLRNLDIRFKGSENQRIIDVPSSLATATVVPKIDGRWQ